VITAFASRRPTAWSGPAGRRRLGRPLLRARQARRRRWPL